MLLFSPEILASFPAQHIYVISADILALFHPELPAESTALPVIFWTGCFEFPVLFLFLSDSGGE